MQKILINRQLPTPEAMAALDAAVKVAVGAGKIVGVGSGPGYIAVYLIDAADETDQNTARQTVLNHDMTARTPEQQERAAIKNHKADVIQRYLESELANKTPTEIYTLMQTAAGNLASLAEAKTFLAKWLPLMAAICQTQVREMKQEG